MELIQKIKSHKKYKTLSDDIVKKELNKLLKSGHFKEPFSKNQEKTIIKKVREKLHRIYSSYQSRKKNKREKILEELKLAVEKKAKNQIQQTNKVEKKFVVPLSSKPIKQTQELNWFTIKGITEKLLSLTLSTKERLPYYLFIYNKIFKITGIPKTIIDLGSGLNPVSYPYMNLSNINYYAYDIDISDIDFLNRYFYLMKKVGINGKAEIKDISTLKVDNLSKADIVFMFKLIDLIDEKKRKTSKDLMKDLFEKNKTKFIVASFSTKTLTRKPMNLPRRIGFEKMLSLMNLKFNSFSIENEIFYVIKSLQYTSEQLQK